MANLIVWFDMSGYVTVPVPDDFDPDNEVQEVRALKTADGKIACNKYNLLTGDWRVTHHEVA